MSGEKKDYKAQNITSWKNISKSWSMKNGKWESSSLGMKKKEIKQEKEERKKKFVRQVKLKFDYHFCSCTYPANFSKQIWLKSMTVIFF